MTKGFVLTVDAIIATITGITMSAVIMYMLFASNVNYIDRQQLASIGNDFLSVLQQTDYFNTFCTSDCGSCDLAGQLNNLLINTNYCGNITLRVYKYRSNDDEFEVVNICNGIRSGCTIKQDIVKVKRIFVKYAKNPDERFGLVEMELWLR